MKRDMDSIKKSINTGTWKHFYQSFYHLVVSVKDFIGISDLNSVPLERHHPTVFLGSCYQDIQDPDFLKDFYSRLWMTYRSHFPPIYPTDYTSDGNFLQCLNKWVGVVC